MTREKVLIFVSTVFTCTDIYISNFSEIQKISKCLGIIIASFMNRSSLISFGWPFLALFDSTSLLFWLHLLPFWALFVLLIWPLLSLVEHMNNLWVTMIKIVWVQFGS